MALDEIAGRILKKLSEGPQTADSLAASCAAGANRLTSPRLVWLAGLGLVENLGADMFAITALGTSFLQLLAPAKK